MEAASGVTSVCCRWLHRHPARVVSITSRPSRLDYHLRVIVIVRSSTWHRNPWCLEVATVAFVSRDEILDCDWLLNLLSDEIFRRERVCSLDYVWPVADAAVDVDVWGYHAVDILESATSDDFPPFPPLGAQCAWLLLRRHYIDMVQP